METELLGLKRGAMIAKFLDPVRTIKKRLAARRVSLEEAEAEPRIVRKAANVTRMVECVMTEVPATRDDDVLLTTEIWRRFYGVGDRVFLSQIGTLPREDVVKRVRAKIQNDEFRLLPLKEGTAHRRKLNLGRWRDAMRREKGPAY